MRSSSEIEKIIDRIIRVRSRAAHCSINDNNHKFIFIFSHTIVYASHNNACNWEEREPRGRTIKIPTLIEIYWNISGESELARKSQISVELIRDTCA